jgi:hypothetical protein
MTTRIQVTFDLDLGVSGGCGVPLETRRRRIDAEAERLVAAGATRLRVLSQEGVDHYGVVMAADCLALMAARSPPATTWPRRPPDTLAAELLAFLA